MGTEAFDRAHFALMTGDDPALQAEILAIFRVQAQLWRRLLIPDAPTVTWADAAHTAKGSARGLGLWRLAEACEHAERLGRGGAVEGRVVRAALERVQAALDEALAALDAPAPACAA